MSRAFAVRDELKADISMASVAHPKTGERFDAYAHTKKGSEVFVTDDELLAEVLKDHPALHEVDVPASESHAAKRPSAGAAQTASTSPEKAA